MSIFTSILRKPNASGMRALGIDIGGSSIKAALVETGSGELVSGRVRLETPPRLAPGELTARVQQLAADFDWQGPIGIGFPAALRQGTVLTAANIDPAWLGVDLLQQFAGLTPGPLAALNDADAAGLAELRCGAGQGEPGTVLVVTVGTGLGTALFHDGVLLPNTELGHLQLDGRDAETFAADAARQREGLSWEDWGRRFDRYLNELARLFWPDLIIVGGGASHSFEEFAGFLHVPVPVRPAVYRNDAGVIGAAQAVACG